MLLSKSKKLFPSRLVGVLCVLALGAGAGACGFEPIYAHKETGYVRSQLEQVRIDPIADRIGQELRNKLYDLLSPRGVSDQPSWKLDITLIESIQKISFEQTSFSTRANLVVTANFILNTLDNKTPQSFSSTIKAISSYNILDSDYANLIAQRDAQSRAVESLGKDIARQLALWMRNLDQ